MDDRPPFGYISVSLWEWLGAPARAERMTLEAWTDELAARWGLVRTQGGVSVVCGAVFTAAGSHVTARDQQAAPKADL